MKKICEIILLGAICFFACCMPAWAQQRQVSGTVTDDKNVGMPGVSVYIKGTTTGTMTDDTGKYRLDVSDQKSVLVFSCIGFVTQEVVAGTKSKIDVQLAEDSQALEEVVIVAYGTARKGDVTGALSNVKPTEGDAVMPSVNSLLEGKIAGLVVGTASSAVGAASSVTIRGANSLRGDNQPLYVIDNVPQASTGEFSGSGIGGDFQIQQDPLSQLNPSDIVDITVLKDASSTAIYGSRGANGVILITTKKGQEGSVRVRASANFTVSEPANLLEMISLSEYADYRNSRISNIQQYPFHKVGNEIRYVFSGSESKYDPGNPDTYRVVKERNWQKEIYTSAFSQNYSLSVDGGNDKITYYISANFKDINGTVKQTSLRQGDLRANLTAKLARNVRLELLLNGSIRENDMMAGGNTLGGATGAVSRTALDYAPFEMPDGDPTFTNENKTTVASWINDYVDKAVNKVFGASFNLTWEISKNFRYVLRTGGNMTTNDRKRWYGMQLYQGMNNDGLLSIAALNRNNYSVENLLMYNGEIGDIARIDATLGVTYDDYNYLNQNTIATKFTFFELRENGLNKAGHYEHPQPEQKDYQLFSYLVRVNMAFLERYMFTASFRADGSSKFAKGNRWGYFPSASVAWRIKQEEFLKDVSWIDQLKLRLSYGVTGNQSINPYSTFSLYGQDSSGDVIYAGPNGDAVTTMIVTNLSNKGLKWEKTTSWNLGLDFGFFNSRLDGTVDVYQKKTSDLLISRTLPGSAGFASTYYNQGGLNNRGVEVSLNALVVDRRDWKWSVSGNIGFNKSSITDLGLDPSDFGALGERVGFYGNSLGDHFGVGHIFLAGEAPGLFYGYRTQGIVQADDITDEGVKYIKDDGTVGYYTDFNKTEPKAGDVKFFDANGDGKVDENDRVIIGNPNPDFTYGFSTKLSYKKLVLSASFNGVSGIDRFNTNNRYINTPGTRSNNLTKKAFQGMWSETNPSDSYPGSAFAVGNYVMDRYIEDASYLRCSDISLSYSLPARWIKNIGMRYCSLSFSVKNAFIITKYSGYDPEVNSFAFDGLRPGVDMSSYPTPRSYIFGINLTF